MKVYMVRYGMDASGYTVNIFSRDCDANENYAKYITHTRHTKKGSVQKSNEEVDNEAAEYIKSIEEKGFEKVDDINIKKYNPAFMY